MANSDRDPLQDFDQLSIAGQYDALLDAIPRAYDEGVLVPLPEEEDQEITDAFIASRLRTVRTRLYLLGYLRKDNQRPHKDKGLEDQIRNFQEDARLQVDGWVGPETWTALQELVSFEEPPDIEHWLAACSDDTLLRRAAGLRLHVLGFLKKRTMSKRKIRRGLRDFVHVAQLLRLAKSDLTPAISLETLTPLFDQDAFVECLALLPGGFADDQSPKNVAVVRRFSAHVAKTELWLLGYGVELDRADVDENGLFPMPPPESKGYYVDPAYSFYTALYAFWKDAGQYAAKARASTRQGLTGAFFQQLLALEGGTAELDLDPVESEQLYAEIVKASKEKSSLPKRIWTYIQDIGSRMWDGIKRAWRWFRRIVDKAKPFVHWARNLARLAYRYALRIFDGVKRLAVRTVESIQFFAHRTVPGSQEPDFVVVREKDLDYRLYASSTFQAGNLQTVTGELRRQAGFFSLGIRMLAALANAVSAVIKAALLPGVGWFVFVLSLVRAYKDLLPLVRESLAYEGA
ncbi:peptidoglycan-binding domain-containing protein [Chloroflexota bacterium]